MPFKKGQSGHPGGVSQQPILEKEVQLSMLKVTIEKAAFSIKEAESYTTLSTTSIWRAIREGDLKAYKYQGRNGRTIILKTDLDTFLQANLTHASLTKCFPQQTFLKKALKS